MNNLEFDCEDFQDILGEGNDWIPINSNEDFEGIFEGNGKKITVTNLDDSTFIYSTANNYAYVN
jgi:hypothetical protein